jgi:hypothetical protein
MGRDCARYASYQAFRPEMPAELTPEAWSMMAELLELVKRTIPSDRPPE